MMSDSEQEQIIKIFKAEYELVVFYTDWLKTNNLTMSEATTILSKQTTK
jgi:hypothetical protein